MMRHFTASVYILHEEKVLLLMHPKLRMWLPPGGHLEPDETPHEAAIREAKEETGCDIHLLSDDPVDVDFWNASHIPRPYLCLLENIPEHKETPAHQHIDCVYLASLVTEPSTLPPECRWFSLEEIMQLVDDREIFAETKKVITHAFQSPLYRLNGATCR